MATDRPTVAAPARLEWLVRGPYGPTGKPSSSLKAVASHVRHIDGYPRPSQFSDEISLPSGHVIKKPIGW